MPSIAVMRLVLEQGYSQAEAARSLGIGCTMISRWVEDFQARSDNASLGHCNLPPSAAEINRLERENKGTSEQVSFSSPILPWRYF